MVHPHTDKKKPQPADSLGLKITHWRSRVTMKISELWSKKKQKRGAKKKKHLEIFERARRDKHSGIGFILQFDL